AEDGIRDRSVTGVQTCALPIWRRGNLAGMDYLSEDRVELRYTLPLAEIIFDFFDALKSRTRGYASLDYEMTGDQDADLVKVDIRSAERRVGRGCSECRWDMQGK